MNLHYDVINKKTKIQNFPIKKNEITDFPHL